MLKQNLVMSASLITLSSTMVTQAIAQEVIDEIVVTARKKSESLQDVPIAVSALGEEQLEELGVDKFTDYLAQLPGVTAGGSGPGQNTIYIRGVASTTPNLTTAGVAGLAPNVALYLDEQPLTQPGRNLDVYAVDMERIEVLSGPQGTLFGASSQAGVVRLITNKPVIGETSVTGRAAFSMTKGGDPSNKLEVVSNIPIGDKLAVRAVIYGDQQGGFIDNVAPRTEITALDSARFRAEGTERSNGVPVSAKREGFQGGANLDAVIAEAADNSDRLADNFNDSEYSGVRLGVRYEADNGVNFTSSITSQRLEADGVFFDDPELGEYKISRYQDDRLTDEFINANWTVDGTFNGLDILYTGALTERETDQVVDYTDYLFVGQYLPHYICDTSVTYPGRVVDGQNEFVTEIVDGEEVVVNDPDIAPNGACSTPESLVTSYSELETESHELRFSGDYDDFTNFTVGVFTSSTELKERNDFVYLGSSGRFVDIYPVNTDGISQPGPYPDGAIFRNDITRTDDQFGVFGEVTYQLVPDLVAVTYGARFYDVETDLKGSARGGFGAKDHDPNDDFVPAPDLNPTANNLTTLFSAAGPGPDKAKSDGVISKLSVSYTPAEDLLYYVTYSEGFRPGVLNRPGGTVSGDYTVPYAVDTDEITNYEFGWKYTAPNGRMRFNGSAFYVDIERLQTTIFDPSIANLFFSENAANAELMGLEGDFTYLPESIQGLTLTGAFSLLDTEVTEVLVPTNDVEKGSSLAYAPELQFNVRARYEWEMGNGMTGHIMPAVVYSDEQYSDIISINRDRIDSSTVVNLSVGMTADTWSGEVYIDNLTDEHAEVARNFVNDRERITPMRPMTLGVRLSRDF